MENIYYKIDGQNVYCTNEQKDGYTLHQDGISSFNDKNVIIELYNDKFILPENSPFLFYGCTNSTFNDMDKWDTSNVTSMYGLFQNCFSLSSLDFSNWDTSNVTTMNSMFTDCYSLTSLDLSNFNTSNVTSMYYMFSNCTSLTSLDLSNFDTSNVTNMRAMFSRCLSLTSVNIFNFNVSQVTDMGIMFYNSSNLEHIFVKPNTDWATEATQLGTSSDMFYNCNKLPNWDGTVSLAKANTSSAGYFTLFDPWELCDVYIKENDTWNKVEVYK